MFERLTTLLLIGVALVACAPSSNTPTPAAPSEVPTNLEVPAGNSEFLRATGRGVQIYTCEQTVEGGPEWTLTAPSAVLENESGFVSSHGAGPSWTATDGSSVVGSKLAENPSPAENAVPWLLVQAEPRGAGAFDQTTLIQRLDTVGGVAPADGCGAKTLGAQTRVPYSATYVFFRAATSASSY